MIAINDNPGKQYHIWEPWNLTQERANEIKDLIIDTSKLMEKAKLPFNVYTLLKNCLTVAKTPNEEMFIAFTLGEFSGTRKEMQPILDLVSLLKNETKL